MSKLTGRILIVEDEKNLGSTLSEYLSALGHECYWAQTGAQAEAIFQENSPQIVLMDIGLPDTNGIELAKSFREKKKDFVLLFLSALNDPDVKVQGLEIGAMDYITKPFALKELTLRLNRILETQSSLFKRPELIEIGVLKIWFSKYEVQDANENIISLGQKECGILELLYENKGNAVTREEIIDKLWGEDRYPSNRTVDNYIVTLRKWCETDTAGSIEIKSIRGIGYKLIIN